MLSFLNAAGTLALRLAPETGKFPDGIRQELGVLHGCALQKYAVMPGSIVDDLHALTPHFAERQDWIATRKPNPTQ